MADNLPISNLSIQDDGSNVQDAGTAGDAGKTAKTGAVGKRGPVQANRPPIRKDKTKKQNLLEVPVPTAEYNKKASEELALIGPGLTQPLLIVLDLNGALVYRVRRGSPEMFKRAHLAEFVAVICNLKAKRADDPLRVFPFIWSSAREKNVVGIVNQVFDEESKSQLVATWHRTQLQLGIHDSANPQVYKQLSWIWSDLTIQAKYPAGSPPQPSALLSQEQTGSDLGGDRSAGAAGAVQAEVIADSDVRATAPSPSGPPDAAVAPAEKVADSDKSLPEVVAPFLPTCWDQTNTVLIDDTVQKGAAEPFNIVVLPEFEGYSDDDETANGPVLLDLLDYLRVASRYQNVSAFIKRYSFSKPGWRSLL